MIKLLLALLMVLPLGTIIDEPDPVGSRGDEQCESC